MDETRFGEEIYRIAYGDYVDAEYSRYIFDGRAYDNHAVETIPGIRLISYFCAAFNAAELNKLSEFFALSIEDGIGDYYNTSILVSFEIDFSSPGAYVLYARRAAMAVTVALLVAITSGDTSLPDARNATLVNSAANSDPVAPSDTAAQCPVSVEEKYRAIMSAMNGRARVGVGLNVRVRKHAGLQPCCRAGYR